MRSVAAFLCAWPLVAGGAPAHGGAPPSHAGSAYARYCASCHGSGGKGDGPAAAALVPPPTDLTTSCLPLGNLMRVIDGRRTIRAHGDASMPVWGRIFEQESSGSERRHRQALREVQALAEYVQHLCVKPPGRR